MITGTIPVICYAEGMTRFLYARGVRFFDYPQRAQEIGSQFSTRIETTTNDVSFFKHHRKVKHREGPPTRELAPVKKSIYSLIDLREILLGCNRRYLRHLCSCARPPDQAAQD